MDAATIEYLKSTNDLGSLDLTKQLDFMLDFFIERPDNVNMDATYEIIGRYIDGLSGNRFQLNSPQLIQDVLLILNELHADGHISYSESFTYGAIVGIRFYKITFKGRVFHQKGGYQNEISEKNAENIRLKNLENHQSRHQSYMTWLTAILSVGQLVQIVYYLIDWNDKSHRGISLEMHSAILLWTFSVCTGATMLLAIQGLVKQTTKHSP